MEPTPRLTSSSYFLLRSNLHLEAAYGRLGEGILRTEFQALVGPRACTLGGGLCSSLAPA